MAAGKGPREIDKVGDLRMEQPGIERQAELHEPRHAGTKVVAPVEAGAARHGAVADDRVGVPGRAMAHAAKAAGPGGDLGLEHVGHAIAQGQVGVAHDAGADAGRAVATAVAHGRHAGAELDLAHRAHLGGSTRAVHRMALVEDGRHDLVARFVTLAEIGQQLIEQIAVARHVPQMMVGIDDREVGLEDRLGSSLGQPRRIRHEDAAERRRRGRVAPGSEQAGQLRLGLCVLFCHCGLLCGPRA